jgi:hypothetical protein
LLDFLPSNEQEIARLYLIRRTARNQQSHILMSSGAFTEFIYGPTALGVVVFERSFEPLLWPLSYFGTMGRYYGEN